MDTTTPHLRSKQPRTVLAGPYGHPFHPIAVTIPIGTWVAAFVFEIIGLVADDASPHATAARILFLIGLVGAVLAAALGLLDFSQVQKGTPAYRTGITHLTANTAVTVLFLVMLIVWWANEPDEVPVVVLILTIVGLLALGFSGWMGGKLAYHYGVRVADESAQAEGFVHPGDATRSR